MGKTAFLAWVVLYFLCCRFPCKVPCTANTENQLKNILWPEIKKWMARLPDEIRSQYDANSEQVFLKSAREQCFAVARPWSETNLEALAGFHEDNLLFVIDEASGVHEGVFETALGALSTEGAWAVMTGNPTRLSGFFYNSHHRNRARWNPIRVNSEDVPRARGHIEDVIAEYGRDSNAYRVRVLGEFPSEEDDALIPLHLIEAANKRDVEPSEAYRVVWGLDVGYKRDPSALCKRRGNVVLEPIKYWRKLDGPQIAGKVKAEYDATWDDEKPGEILVDIIGVGTSAYDHMVLLGLPVRGINVGEAASENELFMRLRDELHWRGREWFEGRSCSMPVDEKFTEEAVAVKYGHTETGKVKVDSKEVTKGLLGRSPDGFDSFLLTFAGGLERVKEHRKGRYARSRRKQHSAMAA